MKKAIKIILGIAGGYLLMDIGCVIGIVASGSYLRRYFPSETKHMPDDVDDLINNGLKQPERTTLALHTLGMQFETHKND